MERRRRAVLLGGIGLVAAGAAGVVLGEQRGSQARPVRLPPLPKPSRTLLDITFGPRGEHLAATGTDGVLRVWNTTTRRTIFASAVARSGPNPLPVAFSPDGRRFAVGHPGGVTLWDPATWRMARTFPCGSDTIDAVAFMPDGTRLVSAHGGFQPRPAPIRIWDLATGAQRSFGDPGLTTFWVAVTRDQRTMVTTGNDGARLWDVPTGRQIATLSQGTASCALSADGHTLATGDYQTPVRLWSMDPRSAFANGTAKAHRTLGIASSLTFAPQGHTLATTDDHAAYLWDTATGRQTHTLTASARLTGSPAFSPDGRLLACDAENGINLWRIR